MKMTDNRNSTETNQTDDASLSTPLFDANASASAQPVEPIRRSRISSLREKVRSASSRINGQSRMLAVVILIGLITGALAGMLLVNIARTSQPAVVEAPANEPASEISATEEQKLDTFAAELAGSDLQTVPPTVARNRKPRARVRTSRPRAYRVAVIR
jgi:hypothetical protein